MKNEQLPNYKFYTLTKHFLDRYKERVNNNMKNSQIESHIRQTIKNYRFVGKTHDGMEEWGDEERGLVILVNPDERKIITVYKMLGEDPNVIIQNEQPQLVTDMLSEFALKSIQTLTYEYYAKMGVMYKEYGDRMDKLSRTMKPENFESKAKEMRKLKDEIGMVNKERVDVLKSLRKYVVDEQV